MVGTWISVKDELPTIHRGMSNRVIVWLPKEQFARIGYYQETPPRFAVVGYGARPDVSHWMSLPGPPPPELEE